MDNALIMIIGFIVVLAVLCIFGWIAEKFDWE